MLHPFPHSFHCASACASAFWKQCHRVSPLAVLYPSILELCPGYYDGSPAVFVISFLQVFWQWITCVNKWLYDCYSCQNDFRVCSLMFGFCSAQVEVVEEKHTQWAERRLDMLFGDVSLLVWSSMGLHLQILCSSPVQNNGIRSKVKSSEDRHSWLL